ncbi:hypothetical protein P7C70_g1807, partial [Phenoliferia sp. Uapishka_3]
MLLSPKWYDTLNKGSDFRFFLLVYLARLVEATLPPPPTYSTVSHFSVDYSAPSASPGTPSTAKKRSFPNLRALATSRSLPSLRTPSSSFDFGNLGNTGQAQETMVSSGRDQRSGGFSALFGRSGSKGRRKLNPPSPLTLASIISPHPAIAIQETATGFSTYHLSSPPPLRGPAPPVNRGDSTLLDQFPTPPGSAPLSITGSVAPPYHLVGRSTGSPRPTYTLHSPSGDLLPLPRRVEPLAAADDATEEVFVVRRAPPPIPNLAFTTPTRPRTPPNSQTTSSTASDSPSRRPPRPTLSISPPGSISPRPPRSKITFVEPRSKRPRSLEYSSSQGSSFQDEPVEAGRRRSSSGSRSGFPSGWLTRTDDGWFEEVSEEDQAALAAGRMDVERDAEEPQHLADIPTAIEGDVFSRPQKDLEIDPARRNGLVLFSPFHVELDVPQSDGEVSSGTGTPSSRFSDDGDSVDTHQSLPFQYIGEGGADRIDPSDSSTLVSSKALSYTSPIRSPGIQPLHLPHRSRPVSRTPSSPFPYSFSTIDSAGSRSTSASPCSPRKATTRPPPAMGRHSLLGPTRPSAQLMRRRASSTSEVDGLKELIFRTQPLHRKRTVGVQHASHGPTKSIATQTDVLPSLQPCPTSTYHRPPPLQISRSPVNLVLTDSPFTSSTWDTTPTEGDSNFQSALSSPALLDSSTIHGGSEVDEDEYRDVAQAELVPAVLSPLPISCRASIVTLRTPPSISPTVSMSELRRADTPVAGILMMGRGKQADERTKALEDEVARLTKVIQVLTGVASL